MGSGGAPQDDRLDIPAPRPRYDWEPVARAEEVPPGTLLGVTAPGGRSICLFNQAGTIGAVHDCCSHADFALSEGTLHADGTLECVWHGARFDCGTGAPRRGPAIDPVAVYEVKVEDGVVYVGAVRRLSRN